MFLASFYLSGWWVGLNSNNNQFLGYLKTLFSQFTIPTSLCVVAGATLDNATILPNEILILAIFFFSTFFIFSAHWIWDAIMDHDEKKLGVTFDDLVKLRLSNFSLGFALPIIPMVLGFLSLERFALFLGFLMFTTILGYSFSRTIKAKSSQTIKVQQIITVLRGLMYSIYAYAVPFLLVWTIFNLRLPTTEVVLFSLILLVAGVASRAPKIHKDRFLNSTKSTRITSFLLFMPFLLTPISYVVLKLSDLYLIISGVGAFALMCLSLFFSLNYDNPKVVDKVYERGASVLSGFIPLAIVIESLLT